MKRYGFVITLFLLALGGVWIWMITPRALLESEVPSLDSQSMVPEEPVLELTETENKNSQSEPAQPEPEPTESPISPEDAEALKKIEKEGLLVI